MLLRVGNVVMKEGLDAVIDFSEISVILPEFGRIAIHIHKFVLVGQFTIIHLVSIVSFGQDIRYHRSGVD